MTGDVLYDDGLVRLDDDGVTIARYYFPSGGDKRVPYGQIRAIHERRMGWLSGRLRGWGTTHPGVWLPLEFGRYRKTTLISLEVGGRVQPSFTPDDPDQVLRLLRSRTEQGPGAAG